MQAAEIAGLERHVALLEGEIARMQALLVEMDRKVKQLEASSKRTPTKYNNSALCAAIEQGVEGKVRAMLAEGAEVNCDGTWDHAYGPIGCAILKEQPGIIMMLIAAGAKPEKAELRLIDLSVRRQNVIANILRDAGAALDDDDLCTCVEDYSDAGVSACLFFGANPDAKHEKSSMSVLGLAILKGCKRIVKLLLDAGASTKSILRLAIGSGDRGILYHVRAAGATLDDADLIIAVKYGLVALVSKCLAAGANPNSVTGCEVTPSVLSLAVYHGDNAIVKLLLDAGADPVDDHALALATEEDDQDQDTCQNDDCEVCLRADHCKYYSHGKRQTGLPCGSVHNYCTAPSPDRAAIAKVLFAARTATARNGHELHELAFLFAGGVMPTSAPAAVVLDAHAVPDLEVLSILGDSSMLSLSATMQKEYSCDFEGCTYKTTKKCNLTRHLLVHADERPFICHYCDYTAKTSEHLKIHMNSSHGIVAVPRLAK